MKLAIDVYYYNDKAKSVGGLFNDWEDQAPTKIISTNSYDILEYESGSFYKRELPCILDLLKQVDKPNIDTIIIDGYVYLNDEGKGGLGYFLYQQLDRQIPIIGVAKKAFYNNDIFVDKIYRGESLSPLYITSIGVDLNEASINIKNMAGKYRIPNILKIVDQQTKVE